MALFNRDYDREYGYRGTARSGYGRDFQRRGYDREHGGDTWENLKRNTREFFGLDNRYDRGYRYDRDLNTTYNRGGTGYGTRTRSDIHDPNRRLGASTGGYGREYTAGRSRYDRPYWGYDTWDYDAEYKSRQQTDAGDPFGDRQSGTPIRVIDEERDRGWFGRDRDADRGFRSGRAYGAGRGMGGYGTDYRSSNAMGYDPYQSRGGKASRFDRERETGSRSRNRGYRDQF